MVLVVMLYNCDSLINVKLDQADNFVVLLGVIQRADFQRFDLSFDELFCHDFFSIMWMIYLTINNLKDRRSKVKPIDAFNSTKKLHDPTPVF